MTIVHKSRHPGTFDVELTIEGHCGLASAGEDVACACISASLWMLIKCMKVTGCSPVIKYYEGFAKVKASGYYADFLAEEFLEQMRELKESYPQCVDVAGASGAVK